MSGPAFALVAPVGGALLSRLDLSQEDIVRDAEAQLHRASSDADLARWARVWGDPVISRLHETADHEDLSEEAGKDAAARAEVEELEKAIKAAADEIRAALDGPADAVAATIAAALSKLEEV